MLTYKRHSLNNLSFIDLFAGIGGFHYALSSFGAKCVYASEWDEPAQQTYFNNFNLVPDGDITKVNEKDISPKTNKNTPPPAQKKRYYKKKSPAENSQDSSAPDITKKGRKPKETKREKPCLLEYIEEKEREEARTHGSVAYKYKPLPVKRLLLTLYWNIIDRYLPAYCLGNKVT